ncbi:unnamed protein product [Nippostrongylus brasiliensis]|uniref:Uncharacterized protein n=1 Tax=Nippostrongylus brasiliensis TaxID=27835 RepID=A0A158R2V0_NIPBR|nr:unnamed protein product [Nippostrongylus brasiliensis]
MGPARSRNTKNIKSIVQGFDEEVRPAQRLWRQKIVSIHYHRSRSCLGASPGLLIKNFTFASGFVTDERLLWGSKTAFRKCWTDGDMVKPVQADYFQPHRVRVKETAMRDFWCYGCET